MDDDLLHDAAVRATVYRERYSRRIYKQLIKLLEDAEASTIAKIERRLEGLTGREKSAFIAGSVSTQRLQTIVDQIRDLAKTVRQIVNKELNVGIKELVDAELAFSKELFGAVSIEAAAGTGVSLTQAVASIKSQPFGGRYLRDMVSDFELEVRKRMLASLREGFVTGETTQQVARQLRDDFEITHRKATTLTRTTMTHFSSRAYEMQYQALGVDKVRWLSTLDSRTSSVCVNLDGREWPIDSDHPRPPRHPNCRSTLIPVLDDDISGTRPAKGDSIKQVRGSTNYPEWFARQSAGFQREVLGATRYKLYRSGRFPLKKFTDPRASRQYTIQELKQRNSSIFKELGL